VAGLGAQPGTRGVDQEPAGLRSEPVGTGHAYGRRLRRRHNACRCHRRGHDHGGRSKGHQSIQHPNLYLLVAGPGIRLRPRHAKVRREGYRKQ
jgi:hypothetical protein